MARITSILVPLLLLLLNAFAQTQPGKSALAAEVNGESILLDDLLSVYGPQFRNLANQEFELRKKALDEFIIRKLFDKEGAKQSITVDELLRREVESKVSEPTLPEVEAYYLGQKDRVGRPFAEVRPQLSDALKQARIELQRDQFLAGLRKAAQIVSLLRQPKTEVGIDTKRIRGGTAAPVTIVEFSDFQCPYCRKSQETVRAVFDKYPGKVRLAFRDDPLKQLHPQAQAAAEASRCAGEQDKYWQYHDLLFAATGELKEPVLIEKALAAGLDEDRFKACLTTGKYRADVERDAQDAVRLGVSGTPGFFVNGVFLNGAVPISAFENLIDQELADHERQIRTGQGASAGQGR